MTYSTQRMVGRPFDAVVPEVRAALAEQGFGIVSEIDLQQTLRVKLDVEVPPHLILGACNPQFAHEALRVEPSIGVLLPCNVVVRSVDGGTAVEMIDPRTMVQLSGNQELQVLAEQVNDRLRAALERLSGQLDD